MSNTNHRALEVFQEDLQSKFRRFEHTDKALTREEQEKSVAKFKSLVATDYKQTQRQGGMGMGGYQARSDFN